MRNFSVILLAVVALGLAGCGGKVAREGLTMRYIQKMSLRHG